MKPSSRYDEFEKILSEKIKLNNWAKDEPMAFFGNLFALMEHGDLSIDEYQKLLLLLPIDIDQSEYDF